MARQTRSSPPSSQSQRSRENKLKMTAAARGIPKDRLAHLRNIKELISRGFYNTEPVLEDVSYSLTRAVEALI